jgi:hypothetical protein
MTTEERFQKIEQTLERTAQVAHETELRLALHHEQMERHREQMDREIAEVKERQRRLDDSMIVQGAMLARLDRRVEEFVDRTEGWMNSAETRMAKLEVLQTAVLERIDRFIAGRDTNGRENGGGGTDAT